MATYTTYGSNVANDWYYISGFNNDAAMAFRAAKFLNENESRWQPEPKPAPQLDAATPVGMWKAQPWRSYDISSEAYRVYTYPNGDKLEVADAVTLLLKKHPDGDRHRLILRDKQTGKEEGIYVKPGWLAIRWQGRNGDHGITF